ncbi:MAG: hypothetical protein U0841_35375 [Chloroflexia bacterium]
MNDDSVTAMISDERLAMLDVEIFAADSAELLRIQAACYAELRIARRSAFRATLVDVGLRATVLLALLVMMLGLGAWLRELMPGLAPVLFALLLGACFLLVAWFVATHDRLNALANQLHDSADFWRARKVALSRYEALARRKRAETSTAMHDARAAV